MGIHLSTIGQDPAPPTPGPPGFQITGQAVVLQANQRKSHGRHQQAQRHNDLPCDRKRQQRGAKTQDRQAQDNRLDCVSDLEEPEQLSRIGIVDWDVIGFRIHARRPPWTSKIATGQHLTRAPARQAPPAGKR